jgi:hypothetical protein
MGVQVLAKLYALITAPLHVKLLVQDLVVVHALVLAEVHVKEVVMAVVVLVKEHVRDVVEHAPAAASKGVVAHVLVLVKEHVRAALGAAVGAAVGAKEPVISHAVEDVMVAVRAAVKELVPDLVLQTTAVLLVVIQEQQFKKGKFMVVKISPEHSDYVEKLFFEYNALKDLIVYMSKDSDVREEDKDYYLEKLGTMYSKLELAKEQVVAKYAPDSYKTYKFLFPECSIQFD